MLTFASGLWYTAWVFASAVAVAAALGRGLPAVNRESHETARRDLLVVGTAYVVVVAFMWCAFQGFGTDRTAGLFLCFAAALLTGVLVPVGYTVWVRRSPPAELGLRLDNWRETIPLALLFGGVQFALTLWGYQLPAPVDWVPLLVMALVVGVFESVFFRGFVQQRLEAAFGQSAGLVGASVLYGAYHVGYGMGIGDIGFLTGLGMVYAVAFAIVRNVGVLWPLLTPMGSFYSALQSGDIDLPWASIAGFLDVLAVMVVAVWLAIRARRRRSAEHERSRASLRRTAADVDPPRQRRRA